MAGQTDHSQAIHAARNDDDASDSPFLEWVGNYIDDPVGFAKDILNFDLLPYQRGPLIALADGERRIAIKSGHGTGKTVDVAIACIWFLLTRYPCRVLLTAPTLQQLEGVLMGTIRSFIQEMPLPLQDLLEVQRDKIFLKFAPDDAWLAARTARAEKPEALSGVHARHVLLCADEASAVPDEVFVNAMGAMSTHGAHTILMSNPTRRSGFFFKTFIDPNTRQHWKRFTFSCRESPLVDEDFIEQVEARFGKDSNEVRVRVDGEFPTEDIDTLISAELVQSAVDRDVPYDEFWPGVLGVDVARMGNDRTAICLRRGRSVEEVKSWGKHDTMETTGKIVAYLAAMPPELLPTEICVDAIGIGAGVADRLTEVCRDRGWHIQVLPVTVNEVAAINPNAYRLKDELWLEAKAWLEKRDCRLPDASDLIEELSTPGYKFDSNGKLRVESKDEIKRRGYASPDVAEAFIMTFAGLNGRLNFGPTASWSQPLKRGLKGIV